MATPPQDFLDATYSIPLMRKCMPHPLVCNFIIPLNRTASPFLLNRIVILCCFLYQENAYIGAPPPMGVIAEEPSGEDTTSNDGSEHPSEVVESAIKLQRVTGFSMRHTKALPASVLKEGWMVHYTNKSTLVREGGRVGGRDRGREGVTLISVVPYSANFLRPNVRIAIRE